MMSKPILFLVLQDGQLKEKITLGTGDLTVIEFDWNRIESGDVTVSIDYMSEFLDLIDILPEDAYNAIAPTVARATKHLFARIKATM